MEFSLRWRDPTISECEGDGDTAKSESESEGFAGGVCFDGRDLDLWDMGFEGV